MPVATRFIARAPTFLFSYEAMTCTTVTGTPRQSAPEVDESCCTASRKLDCTNQPICLLTCITPRHNRNTASSFSNDSRKAIVTEKPLVVRPRDEQYNGQRQITSTYAHGSRFRTFTSPFATQLLRMLTNVFVGRRCQ